MRIEAVGARSDNYMYLLIDTSSPAPHPVAAIDPYDVSRLTSHASSLSIPLALGTHVLTTHHHADHAGGNKEFLSKYPDAKIFGGSDQVEALNTTALKHGDEVQVGNLKVRAIHTPCHTQDHICFYVEAPEGDGEGEGPKRAVFTGDTLFVGGCGRFFEGEPEEMHQALNERLAGLPEDTTVWNGHEYTKSNVAFGKHVDPKNEAVLSLHKFAEKEQVTTGKFTIGDEKRHNVFMRLESEAVKQFARKQLGDAKETSLAERMGTLREAKNNFKG